jgi:chromosome segregation ATPase
MSNLSEIVDSLENRIGTLLNRHDKLKIANAELEEELAFLRSKQQQFENEIDVWTEKCNSLKLANSMLGSDQHKRETKLKINALVREIDQCITHLSE